MSQAQVIQLKEQLIILEAAMQKAGLWSQSSPTEDDLSSQEPFCVDKLAFEDWLQWIFIPNMKAMLSMPAFNGLLHASDIHTMATHVFKSYPEDTHNINQTIKKIDHLINSFDKKTLQ